MAHSLPAPVVKKVIDLEELYCPICQEIFNDKEQNPRNLNCGHTYCTTCLHAILIDDPLCPECRTYIHFRNVESIPVLYIVRKLVDSVDELNKRLSKPSKNTSPKNLAQTFQSLSLNHNGEQGGKILATGTCMEHNAPKQLWCKTCSVWACGMCVFLKHQKKATTHQAAACSVVLSTIAVGEVRSDLLKKINDQRSILAGIANCLAILTRNNSLPYFLNNAKCRVEDISDDIDILDETVDYVSNIGAATLNDAVKYVDNLFSVKHYPMNQEDILQGFVTLFFTKNKRLNVKHLDLNSSDLVATCMVNGKKKYFKLGFNKVNAVWVHNYEHSKAVFRNPLYFHLSDLFVEGLHVFMELFDEERNESLGIILMKVFKNTQRGRLFRMLCTGEAGPSYRGTRFFGEYGTMSQYICGGDYERNDGTAGKTLFDFEQEDPSEEEDMVEGIVCGYHWSQFNRLAQFKIFHSLLGHYNHNAKGPVAVVVQGLGILRTIALDKTWQDVIISDTGMLFYTTD